MNSLFSFARHKSSIINSPVPIILLLLLCCIAGCRGGHPAEKEEADDLQQIKDSGELVVLTLYSSTSYFIYRGQDMGFQYELSEQFAKSLGVKLRIEVARNVHELIEKLQARETSLPTTFPSPRNGKTACFIAAKRSSRTKSSCNVTADAPNH